MKRLSLIFLSLTTLTGCAAGAPVQLNWTYPRFNAVSGSCSTSTADTLRDLNRIDIWAQVSGRTDSTLASSRTASGRESRPDSITIQQAEGTTTYWLYLFDVLNNRSCRSNTVAKTIVLVPAKVDSLR